MKRYVGVVAALTLFLSANLLRADDAITIKFKEDAPGDVVQVDKTVTTTATTKVVDGAGKVLNENKQVSTEAASYTTTTLKREAKKKATLLERKYDKATVTVDGKAKELPYQGKTVVIEKKGDQYTFTVNGKELTGEDAQVLTKEFNKGDDEVDLDKAMLPKEPVKVNDNWKIDMAPLLKDITKDGELEIDSDKAKGTGTLLKVYKKDGKQFGTMKLEVTLPLQALGKAPMKLVTQEGSNARLEVNMDVCIDGSRHAGTMKGTMKLDAKASPDGKVMVNVAVQTQSEETRKELPKK